MLSVQEEILELESELRERDARLRSQSTVLDSIQECLMETNDINTASQRRISDLEVPTILITASNLVRYWTAACKTAL